MSPKLLMPGLLSAAVVTAVFIAYARPALHASHEQDVSQSIVTSVAGPESANLAMQPEAVKLSRRVRGERFDAKKPRSVILQGVLTTGTEHRTLQIKRSQSESGEQVEIALAGADAALRWDATSGARSSAGAIDFSDRALLERFTFDSADEFILAQLRGASYSVVARNVRPDDAADDYSGAIWDVVRVDDPEQDQQKKPLSAWRLYYINTKTGLLDRIVCDSQGDRIDANLSDWIDQSGEKFPSAITWTSQGRTLMSFNLTNVSYLAQ